MADIILRRRWVHQADKNSGWAGIVVGDLIVGALVIPCMERVGTPWLRKGSYIVERDVKNTKRKIPCLRPIVCAYTTLLIHDALNDNPWKLTGCIAPGMGRRRPDMARVWESKQGMDKLLEALGNPEIGARFELLVENNPPYSEELLKQTAADHYPTQLERTNRKHQQICHESEPTLSEEIQRVLAQPTP
ncbi:MAG: hypothetical protein AAF074_19735 [Pseudomonadota bacterium]